mmetsp:Transcript_19582/g.27898  ORF Transcript_19582/g.27898 Transcript_19582/m.27898 type:complete len:86 (+) Transcript_19582:129-386(+)
MEWYFGARQLPTGSISEVVLQFARVTFEHDRTVLFNHGGYILQHTNFNPGCVWRLYWSEPFVECYSFNIKGKVLREDSRPELSFH